MTNGFVPKPRVRVLARPLSDSIPEAVNLCLAEEAGTAEEWLLPSGTNVFAAAIDVDLSEYDLTLVAEGTSRLSFTGSPRFRARALAIKNVRFECNEGAQLTLEGVESVALSLLTLTGGRLAVRAPEVTSEAHLTLREVHGPLALDVFANNATILGARVTFARPGATLDPQRTAIRVTATRVAAVTDAEVGVVTGDNAAGVLITAERARLAQVLVRSIQGLRGDGIATGISVFASRRLDVSALTVLSIEGRISTGISLIAGGSLARSVTEEDTDEDTAHASRIFDVTVNRVDGLLNATGVAAACVEAMTLRGFTVTHIAGPSAIGVLLAGGDAIEASVGRVDRVLGRAGRAAGVRVLGQSTLEDIVVHDLAVSGVGTRLRRERVALATSSGPFPVQPANEWIDWTTSTLDAVDSFALELSRSAEEAEAPANFSSAVIEHPGLAPFAAFPTAEEIAGVMIDAPSDGPPPVEGEWGALILRDTELERIGGAGVQLRGGLRTVKMISVSSWLTNTIAWLQGEDTLLASSTLHQHERGVVLGSGVVRAYNLLITNLTGGPALRLEDDADLSRVEAVFSTVAGGTDDPRVAHLATLPYVRSGSATLPRTLDRGVVPVDDETVDLRFRPEVIEDFVRAATGVPGEPEVPAVVGAYPPPVVATCEARDPEPRPLVRPQDRFGPNPSVDYRARDYEGLLKVMNDRALVTMPAATERGPADFLTILFEALAYRLDMVAYAQERAIAEGFLETAELRRSVEDHARVLDADPDPGLSATAMLRFSLSDETLANQDLLDEILEADGSATIPAETLVSNGASPDTAVIFSTEEALVFVRDLDRVRLAEACAIGATSAVVENESEAAMRRLIAGRWLILAGDEPGEHHVVRVTGLEPQAQTTVIYWDPRRPLLFAIPRSRGDRREGSIYANVVPAHHGLRVSAMPDPRTASQPSARALERLRALLTVAFDARAGARELDLSIGPLSSRASGYPLPGEEERRGASYIEVAVDDERWEKVEDLSAALPSDEVFTVRHRDATIPTLRFGDGENGAALPDRTVELKVDLRIGLGAAGNVGAETLIHVVGLGAVLEGTEARSELLRESLVVSNPLAAIGGRDPESLAVLRYRAPAGVMDARSAVAVADYERLLKEINGVLGVRARALLDGIRPLVRATVLLANEDTMPEAERLRLWATVRKKMEEIRLAGNDVEVVPPRWVPLDLDLAVDATPHAHATSLRDRVVDALAGNGGLFDPDRATLGGDVHLSRLYKAALAVPGVTGVRVTRFRRLELHALDGADAGVLPMAPDEIAILRAPLRAGVEDGLLTVTVCGGLR